MVDVFTHSKTLFNVSSRTTALYTHFPHLHQVTAAGRDSGDAFVLSTVYITPSDSSQLLSFCLTLEDTGFKL